ncbi:hypothetical protein MP638_004631 [Amoeboaphelidium occidentale]|nr:hypothetical protein MP638_004631 [Amoeboaphelidium occidentale]
MIPQARPPPPHQMMMPPPPPPHGMPPVPMMSIPKKIFDTIPADLGEKKRTLYLRNLNDRINTTKLTATLRELFSKFGTIKRLTLKKNILLKGQAFVEFETVESATKALESLQHFPLYNQKAVISYARKDSGSTGDNDSRETKYTELKEKISARPTAPPYRRRLLPEELLQPNRILFIQHLPQIENVEALLKGLFARYPGFIETRTVPNQQSIAFVEYENEHFATMAKDQLNFVEIIKGRVIKVGYARR